MHCYNCYYGQVMGIFIRTDCLGLVVVYTVNDLLLVMYCMCLPAYIVTSADKSHLWMLFTILYCLKLFVVV